MYAWLKAFHAPWATVARTHNAGAKTRITREDRVAARCELHAIPGAAALFAMERLKYGDEPDEPIGLP